MCRNITTLRGLDPEATDEEIEAAARQYVRKVSGVQKTSAATEEAFELAVEKVTAAGLQVAGLLGGLDHGQADPVLHAPPGVEVLDLRKDGRRHVGGEAGELDERGVAHDVQQRIDSVHVFLESGHDPATLPGRVSCSAG